MSDTSVALISAGSALAASLITGGLTWLAGRSHLGMQLRDQKWARREQHRREVYASCLELLTSYVMWSLALTARRSRGESERVAEAHQKVADGAKAMMQRSAEMDLVGPPPVASAFDTARSAALEVSTVLDRLLEEGVIVAGEYPSEIGTEMQTFNRSLEAFTNAARRALDLD
ncbi:hypothetical protein K4749_22845 [Streptomyces sp. TRM72054]|uniref:hypothetical protein n=1 Tax=Streptomyces sp. TRM72054 TaxID=2870562 RepID=UPI001C8C3C08|nr:hypothetical protein [Streptomyces sp. TRM72054]MBX9396352.1 hypothetical protein [Streptomyces sp. TRM72054]